MNIVIVGPGAIGLLFYFFLKTANSSTYLLDKSAERAERIRKRGIKITGISGEHILTDVSITSEARELPPADIVLICVKSYDTESAITNALSCISESTYIMSLQNGIGNAEVIEKYIKKERILIGITNQGATLISEGEVKHAGKGETIIGCYEKRDFIQSKKILDKFISCFANSGLEIRKEENIESVIWSKLIINAGINALTAVTNFKNGRLVEIDSLKVLMHKLISEAFEIVSARNIKLLYDEPYKKAEEVCLATRDNISSMLQDILKNKYTEIESINGAIVREGEKLGIDVSFNRFIRDLVRGIEAKKQERILNL